MKIVGCDLHTRYQQIAMLDAGCPSCVHVWDSIPERPLNPQPGCHSERLSAARNLGSHRPSQDPSLRSVAKAELPRYARDFARGLRRPRNGSTSRCLGMTIQ